MYSNNRDAYRQFFFSVWQKYQKKLPLEAAEARLVDVILQHPEYHSFLEKPDAFTHQEFALEENPFIHMSLHMALREQIDMNRPAGIKTVEQELKLKHPDPHQIEHQMMECLCSMMAKAQQTGITPDDASYLELLRKINK